MVNGAEPTVGARSAESTGGQVMRVAELSTCGGQHRRCVLEPRQRQQRVATVAAVAAVAQSNTYPLSGSSVSSRSAMYSRLSGLLNSPADGARASVRRRDASLQTCSISGKPETHWIRLLTSTITESAKSRLACGTHSMS